LVASRKPERQATEHEVNQARVYPAMGRGSSLTLWSGVSPLHGKRNTRTPEVLFKQRGRITLASEHSTVRPLVFLSEAELEIFGMVTYTLQRHRARRALP